MRRGIWSLPAAAVAPLAIAAALCAEPATAEVSARYSGAVVFSQGLVHGAALSLGTPGPGVGLVADAGLYIADDGALLLTAGPRWSSAPDAAGTSFFVQALAGAALGGGSVFFANPGFGVDLRADRALGARFQLDGPVVTAEGIEDFVRVSAGIVWRPGRARRTR